MEAQNDNLNLNFNMECLLNEESLSQRDKLTKEIKENSLTCIICYDHIIATDPVWFCDICYQIYHLSCIKKWDTFTLRSAKDFTCPGCNLKCRKTMKSFCFCGKVENPTVTSNYLAHSCGELCSKQLKCEHSCNILCHPGPHVKCGCSLLYMWMHKAFKFFRYSLTLANIFLFICFSIVVMLVIIIALLEVYGEQYFHIKTLFGSILSRLRKGNRRREPFRFRMINNIYIPEDTITLRLLWLKNYKRINELD